MAKYDSLWTLGTLGFMAFSILFGDITAKSHDSKKPLIQDVSLETRIRLGENIIEDPTTKLENLHPDYNFNLEELEKFNSWIDSTLEESVKDSSNAIIIDKSAHLLYLIKNGKIDSQYNVEVGQRRYLDKQKEGDMHSPEGMYETTWKMTEEVTDFYKAFLLNYPNTRDKKQDKTGGAIEIHGRGSGKPKGKGLIDWTWGCFALSDQDIDSIFPYINNKDRVTVVRYTDKNLNPKDQIFRDFFYSLYK